MEQAAEYLSLTTEEVEVEVKEGRLRQRGKVFWVFDLDQFISENGGAVTIPLIIGADFGAKPRHVGFRVNGKDVLFDEHERLDREPWALTQERFVEWANDGLLFWYRERAAKNRDLTPDVEIIRPL